MLNFFIVIVLLLLTSCSSVMRSPASLKTDTTSCLQLMKFFQESYGEKFQDIYLDEIVQNVFNSSSQISKRMIKSFFEIQNETLESLTKKQQIIYRKESEKVRLVRSRKIKQFIAKNDLLVHVSDVLLGHPLILLILTHEFAHLSKFIQDLPKGENKIFGKFFKWYKNKFKDDEKYRLEHEKFAYASEYSLLNKLFKDEDEYLLFLERPYLTPLYSFKDEAEKEFYDFFSKRPHLLINSYMIYPPQNLSDRKKLLENEKNFTEYFRLMSLAHDYRLQEYIHEVWGMKLSKENYVKRRIDELKDLELFD